MTWKNIPIKTTIDSINIEGVFQVCIDWLKDPDAKPDLKKYAEIQLMHFGKKIHAQVHGLPDPESPFKEAA